MKNINNEHEAINIEDVVQHFDGYELDNLSYDDLGVYVFDNLELLDLPNSTRPKFNVIAICNKGRMTVNLDGKPMELHDRQILICPPESTLTDTLVSPDFNYTALCLTNQALQFYLRGYMNVWNEFIYIKKLRSVDVSLQELEIYSKINDLLKLFRTDDEQSEHSYIVDMHRSILKIVLVGFCSLLRKQADEVSVKPQNNISLFNRFLDLLQKSEYKHRSVASFASELCISTKYLTIICKKNSGRTPNDWIKEYTLNDITHYLRGTELSVKEISNKIGFPNTSFFGKYVKEHLGCTPLEYRKNK